MLTIETARKQVEASQEEVFNFLSDMNNLEKLMPEQVINWKSDQDSCSYTIKGMADIGMRIKERISPEKLIMVSEGKVPFDFTLILSVGKLDSNADASLRFEGAVNPFLKMMVEKPLSNFFNLLVDGLTRQFG